MSLIQQSAGKQFDIAATFAFTAIIRPMRGSVVVNVECITRHNSTGALRT
jgi:hypothetical protein